MSDDSSRTEISEIGEFGLINRLSKRFSLKQPSSVKGIGDDAAVVNYVDETVVISSDMLIEGVHFDLSYVPLTHLGYKAVAVNVSDIASMLALPTQIIVNVAVSNRFSVEAVEAIYEGVHAACENYRIDLVGGDTTASNAGLVISITVMGKILNKQPVYRSGAGKNDILCVTGDLGAAYLGLQVLEREKQVFLANPEMQPEIEKYEYVVGRQLKPEARMDVIYDFKEKGVIPTSMIDISDGLASESLHLCKQSNCGVVIHEEKIPVDMESFKVAEEFKLNSTTCAMNGGEDYELLFTIRQTDFDKVSLMPDVHTIGYITEEKQALLVTRSGTTATIKSQGWKHF
jgi:thiamine-monophosphate kinase